MSTLLETRKVSKSFGVLRALQDVSMAVREGELVSVVGPNGAGKTTLVNLLTGLLEPSAGEVLFKGRSIAGIGPVELAGPGFPAHPDLPATHRGGDHRGRRGLTAEKTLAPVLAPGRRRCDQRPRAR